ncbi:hypothetical protein BGZ81_009222 [Podila clonocystis]|nr:hypothetical protein BGZ81_009222 [Podila clonocystis]
MYPSSTSASSTAYSATASMSPGESNIKVQVPTTTTPSSYNPGPSPSNAQGTTNAVYKAEMTENQAITWQQKQQAASNIKVELPTTIPPSSPVAPNRPFPSSSSSGPYSPHQQNQMDIQAQIQVELQRASQLTALHHSRRNSSIGGGPASPLSSWTQPYGGPTPVEHQSPLTDNNPISPSMTDPPFPSDRPSGPFSCGGANSENNFGPSAIEEQSSLTEVGAPSDIEHQSSLTEVDSSVSGKFNIFIFAPKYSGPSAIENQSSLTEVDNLPHPIDEQSSLTEVDNLPTVLGEQSSLTVVDDLPHALHEQSSLTVIDDLPHALHEQSSLTVVDDIPHALHEQSSLTVIDDLPHALHEQSSLTAVDDLPHSKEQPSLTTVDEPSPKNKPSEKSPSLKVTSTSEEIYSIPTSPTSPTTSPEQTSVPSSFSMSNWTMPDFSQSATEDTDTTVHTSLKSPFGSLHKRAPATHLDTSVATHDNVLIPVAPGPADIQDPPRPNPFLRSPSGPPVPAPKPASLIAKMNPQSGPSGAAMTVSEEIRLAMLPSTDYEGPTEPEKAVQTIAHFEVEEATEESEEEEEEEEEEEGLGRDDGVSAFIRELQSSITVSRSDSGTDIAGKVYMTLGLKNTDLFKMWQLINPDEKSVLSRTYFIAGLHLVNSRVVGYELPAELPDELMLSAAAVGRIKVPPRPVQGPNTIVESSPSVPQPTYSHMPDKAPPPQPSYSTPDKSAPSMSHGISSFMPNYSLSFDPPAETPSEIYQAHPALPSIAEMQQQRQQIQQQESTTMHRPAYVMSPPAQAKQPAKSNGYSSSSSNSSPANSTTLVQAQRPGPHAVHNMGMDASYFDDEPSQRSEVKPKATTTPGATSRSFTTTTTTTTSTTSDNSTLASQVARAQNSHSIYNAALYASPPNAWDHDAAAPELDVEGNYIKYRSDFKNDMMVSASVTANHPINPKSGVFYFEIMIDRFKGNSPISIGIASKNLRKNLQVGWDLNSWGYHSDDGFLYFGNSQQNIAFEFGYSEGDTVGCGVNFLEKSVFFTLNGDMLGVAFKFLKDTIPLYPAIGLSQAGTEINANFGDQTFLFNIVAYKKQVSGKPLTSLPKTTWNAGTRNDKVFQVLPDGLSVIASGKDAGCIRGPKLSPRDKDVFYFEVTILYMPNTELGTIVVGICGKNQSMTETLGWNANSYGYSGECGDFLSVSSNRSSLNARSQSGKMKARARGPPFKSGSVVGCGVDFASRELFFTLNGECLGQAFYELDVLDCYPCVSVVDAGGSGVGGPLSMLQEPSSRYSSSSNRQASSSGTNDRAGFEFKANFGQFPFLFDLPAFETNEGLMLL